MGSNDHHLIPFLLASLSMSLILVVLETKRLRSLSVMDEMGFFLQQAEVEDSTIQSRLPRKLRQTIYLSLLQELHKALLSKWPVELKAEPSRGHKPDEASQQEVRSQSRVAPVDKSCQKILTF